MNRDQFRGASRHLKGRLQSTFGGLTGHPGRQMRGAANQAIGGAQYVYGTARSRAQDLAESGRGFAESVWDRADRLHEDGRQFAGEADRFMRNGEWEGRRRPVKKIAALVGVAIAVGLLARSSR